MLKRIEYKVGEFIKFKNELCPIVKVHPFGTVDIERPSTGERFLVTGLPTYEGIGS